MSRELQVEIRCDGDGCQCSRSIAVPTGQTARAVFGAPKKITEGRIGNFVTVILERDGWMVTTLMDVCPNCLKKAQ